MPFSTYDPNVPVDPKEKAAVEQAQIDYADRLLAQKRQDEQFEGMLLGNRWDNSPARADILTKIARFFGNLSLDTAAKTVRFKASSEFESN